MFDKELFLSLCDKYDVEFSETANEPIICEYNKKLVQHIKMDMPGIPKQGIYCYGEASFETNMEMQEPSEKLYRYEQLEEELECHTGMGFKDWLKHTTSMFDAN